MPPTHTGTTTPQMNGYDAKQHSRICELGFDGRNEREQKSQFCPRGDFRYLAALAGVLWKLSHATVARGDSVRSLRYANLNVSRSFVAEGWYLPGMTCGALVRCCLPCLSPTAHANGVGLHEANVFVINAEEKGRGKERTTRGFMQHRDVTQDVAFAIAHLFAVMFMDTSQGRQRHASPTFGDGSEGAGNWAEYYVFPGGNSGGRGKAKVIDPKVRGGIEEVGGWLRLTLHAHRTVGRARLQAAR